MVSIFGQAQIHSTLSPSSNQSSMVSTHSGWLRYTPLIFSVQISPLWYRHTRVGSDTLHSISQFKPVLYGIDTRTAHLHKNSTRFLRRFLIVAFETFPRLSLIENGLYSVMLILARCLISVYTSLLQTMGGVMFLALCSQVVFQAPQHFRYSDMHKPFAMVGSSSLLALSLP